MIASTGGTSSRLIDSEKYWPTPWMSKTVSVRIAPPPSTAPKSRPQSVMTGMSELRSTWWRSTRFSPSPLARAVRT